MSNTLITRRNILLSSAAVGAVAGFGIWRAQSGEILEAGMDADKAHKLAQKGEIILIDVRRPDEWESTGIPSGAVPLDMRRPDFIDAFSQVAATASDKPVVLICAGGVRSARARAATAEPL